MFALTESLKSILSQMGYDPLTWADDQDTVHVIIKLPHNVALHLIRPLSIRHDLFYVSMPTAPVVGWFFEIRGIQENPVRRCVWFNVQDVGMARNLESICLQESVAVHFVDGRDLTTVATKGIFRPQKVTVACHEARAYAAKIPAERYDFNWARAEFQEKHSPDEIAGWLLSSCESE